MIEVEVWVIHAKREVLATDLPGPPGEICGFVSAEAEAAVRERGYATVSDIGFPQECYLGLFEGEGAWQKAMCVAYAKAEELGYEVRTEDSRFPECDGDPVEEDWVESDTGYVHDRDWGEEWEEDYEDDED